MKTHINSITRIESIDFLRGFALWIVALSNVLAISFGNKSQDSIEEILHWADIFFFKNIWISLSFLFGFGFWNLMQRKNGDLNYFLRRMFWLMVIGIVNSLLFFGDILKDFAIVGVFTLLALYLNKRNLLILTLILTFSIPFLPHLINQLFEFKNDNENTQIPNFDIISIIKFNLQSIKINQFQNPHYYITVHGLMLCAAFWGILANRNNFFHKLKNYKKSILIVSILGIIFLILSYILKSNPIYKSINQFYNFGIFNHFISNILMMSFGLGLYRIAKNSVFYKSIVNYGKMTLTHYLTQSLIFVVLILMIEKYLLEPLTLAILISIIYILQLFISNIWMKNFQFGPVEWFWRSLSEQKFLPFKK